MNDRTPAYSRIFAMPAQLKAFSEVGGARIIEGMASTPALDRQGEVVRPASMLEGLAEFLANGLMSWNHEWWEPIGKWTAAEVRDDGLFVRGEVLAAGDELADKVWRRIEQGVVKTLSIGFNPRGDAPGHYEEESGVYHWDNISLLEIAVTPLPANPEATLRTAKSLGLPMALPARLCASQVLPLIDAGFDPIEASKRLREAPDAQDAPCYADCIDGRVVAVWRGVQAAMAAAKGLRGEGDPEQVRALVPYYQQRGEDVAQDVTADEQAAFEETDFFRNLHGARGNALSATNIVRHWAKEGRVLSTVNRAKVETAVGALDDARDALAGVLQADADSRESRALPALALPKRADKPHLPRRPAEGLPKGIDPSEFAKMHLPRP